MQLRGPKLKEHILSTATELFYQDGFRATGVDLIAKVAGITKRSLYNHFATKELLISSVLKQRHDRWISNVETSLEKHDSAEEKIMGWFQGLEDVLASDSYRGCIFFNAAIEFPNPPEPIKEVLELNTQAGHDLLVRLCREANFPEPEGLARQLSVLRRGAQMSVTVTQDPDFGNQATLAARALLRSQKLIGT